MKSAFKVGQAAYYRFLHHDIGVRLSHNLYRRLSVAARTATTPRNVVYAPFNPRTRTLSSSESFEKHECWKCGSTNEKDQLFCLRIDCNAVLPVTEKNVNFFETFGFDVQYKIDEKLLDTAFKQLQKRLHPDKFATANRHEQQLSTQSSSVVNSAYKVLKSPIDRAFYMIFLLFNRDIYEEESLNQNAQLMLEMFELREQIEESHGNEEARRKLADLIQQKFDDEMKYFERTIQQRSEDEAVVSATRLKYFGKMLEELS